MSGFADFPLAKGLTAVVDPLITGIIDGTGSNLLDQVTPVTAELLELKHSMWVRASLSFK